MVTADYSPAISSIALGAHCRQRIDHEREADKFQVLRTKGTVIARAGEPSPFKLHRWRQFCYPN